ncbi:MAG: DUF3592 domain-containing protein [Opitutaceae bacterium]
MKIGKVRLTLIIVALTSLGFLARGYIHLSDIRDWPSVKGVITDYDSGTHKSTSHSQQRMQSINSEKWSRIVYRYYVNGIAYTSNRISPNIKATFPYKKGNKEVEVFYNPSNHSESYLLTEGYYNPLLIGFSVASVLVFGIDLACYGRQLQSNPDRI